VNLYGVARLRGRGGALDRRKRRFLARAVSTGAPQPEPSARDGVVHASAASAAGFDLLTPRAGRPAAATALRPAATPGGRAGQTPLYARSRLGGAAFHDHPAGRPEAAAPGGPMRSARCAR
jgi:hypothetical protein